MQSAMLKSSTLRAVRPASRVFCPVECKAADKKTCQQARHMRIRKKLSGTTERPRLAVHRSNDNIYAQVIDDTTGHTLAAANTLMKDIKTAFENGSTVAAAEAVGKKLAEQCKEKNIVKVAFDRGGFIYHGRVQAVAEGARAGGLDF